MDARLPFAPLETLAGGRPHELARRVGRNSRQVYRWRSEGLSPSLADRLATRLGFHPSNVWPEWDVA